MNHIIYFSENESKLKEWEFRYKKHLGIIELLKNINSETSNSNEFQENIILWEKQINTYFQGEGAELFGVSVEKKNSINKL